MEGDGLPRSRSQQKEYRVKGDIRGYMKLGRGRPPKDKTQAAPKRQNSSETAFELPVASTNKKAKRGSYVDWSKPSNFTAVQAALDNGDSVQK